MRVLIISLLVIAGLTALLIFQPSSTPTHTSVSAGMPWQIESDGQRSTVFKVSPGHSSLEQAIQALGMNYELALLAKSGETGAIELFYDRFRAGPLQARVVITAESSEAERLAIKESPLKEEYLETGTKKFLLTEAQTQNAMQLTVESLTMIPAARLDEELLEQRFGKPEERIEVNEEVSHYLFPDKGLAVRVDTKGKDMLHYVSPKDFGRLAVRLRAEVDSQGK